MGICESRQQNIGIAFIVPEQEFTIHTLELSHPFARFQIDDLLCAFRRDSHSETISEQDFFKACERLEIPAEPLMSREFLLYVDQFKSPGICYRRLQVSLILLANADWESKLGRLFRVFESGKWISET